MSCAGKGKPDDDGDVQGVTLKGAAREGFGRGAPCMGRAS